MTLAGSIFWSKKSLRRLPFLLVIAVLLGAGANALLRATFFRASFPEGIPVGLSVSELGDDAYVEVATGLETPWEIGFLPGGDLLVTERPGRLVRLSPSGGRVEWMIEESRQRGEGGLMGLALHPRFGENRWLYLAFTSESDNRVVRYTLTDAVLSDPVSIIEGIPAAAFHDGGRIEFGPDGLLYITTGDGGVAPQAQDPASLAGKILRLDQAGRPASDNPLGSAVWSYGHRNPQGLAWDGEGRLWATEHGRSGVGSGLDELNRVEPGGNHGWPVVEGDASATGMVSPVLHSGPDVTWAPSDVEFVDGSFFFGGLRGQALYQTTPRPGGGYGLVVHFFSELGRIRVVRLGPDGWLYLGTSNRDGRGGTNQGDDRIVRIDPSAFTTGDG